MDTTDLAERLHLEPLDIAVARDVIGLWELRWWEAVRTSQVTAPEEKEHGDVTDPEEAVVIATQWCGRSFSPGVTEFFAVNLTGLRLALDEFMAEERRKLEERVDVLEGMVRGAFDAQKDDVSGRVARLEERADEIHALLTRLVG